MSGKINLPAETFHDLPAQRFQFFRIVRHRKRWFQFREKNSKPLFFPGNLRFHFSSRRLLPRILPDVEQPVKLFQTRAKTPLQIHFRIVFPYPGGAGKGITQIASETDLRIFQNPAGSSSSIPQEVSKRTGSVRQSVLRCAGVAGCDLQDRRKPGAAVGIRHP